MLATYVKPYGLTVCFLPQVCFFFFFLFFQEELTEVFTRLGCKISASELGKVLKDADADKAWLYAKTRDGRHGFFHKFFLLIMQSKVIYLVFNFWRYSMGCSFFWWCKNAGELQFFLHPLFLLVDVGECSVSVGFCDFRFDSRHRECGVQVDRETI